MHLVISTQNLSTHLLQTAMPVLVDTTIQAGFQDSRIGKIVGGVGLIASGVSSIVGSGMPKMIKSWYQNVKLSEPSIQNLTQESSSKKCLRWGVAAVGLAATCYGVYNVALGIMELTSPETNQDKLFLVCHDNKPKLEQKLGRTLPRLAVVDSETGEYHEVHLNNNPLSKAKDLESLKWIKQNEYLTCESKGTCFQFSVSKNGTSEYSATVLKQFKLAIPNKFYNIESIALKGPENSEICWSHRGGILAGEEPWTRCASLDLDKGQIGEFTEVQVEDPFGIPNNLNRAISDHAIGEKTGKDYFIATIDTEGSEGIDATKDQAYSFLYTKNSCLKFFPGEKVEALHINTDETFAIITTDNEDEGSKICTFSLELDDLNCVNVLPGEEHGIGGIAPLKGI